MRRNLLSSLDTSAESHSQPRHVLEGVDEITEGAFSEGAFSAIFCSSEDWKNEDGRTKRTSPVVGDEILKQPYKHQDEDDILLNRKIYLLLVIRGAIDVICKPMQLTRRASSCQMPSPHNQLHFKYSRSVDCSGQGGLAESVASTNHDESRPTAATR